MTLHLFTEAWYEDRINQEMEAIAGDDKVSADKRAECRSRLVAAAMIAQALDNAFTCVPNMTRGNMCSAINGVGMVIDGKDMSS